MPEQTTAWLPDDFTHPPRVPVGPDHHLRPIRASDAEIDMVAVMGSQPRLYSLYGKAWGWPPATMTLEQDREDLAHHEAEIEAHESFNYALLDTDETVLLGCVYIEPPTRPGFDAEVSWWVVDDQVGTDLEAALDELVPRWIGADWPFERPVYIGREISFDDYLALPGRE
jgi:hypothetical protein